MNRSIFALAAVVLLAWIAAPQPAAGADEDSPIVLITGANRGLGLEFARQYTADGWYVIGTARKPDTATELKALGVTVLQLDVADPESVAALAAQLENKPIDMLINNAGIFPRFASLAETEFDSVELMLSVNVMGPMRVTQALLPNLQAGDQKMIVNISSSLGSIENNGSGRWYGYRESKAALNMFSKTLAVELAEAGFTSIALHPGWVRTDMGGPTANLAPEESVTGMRSVIEKVTFEDSGTYWGYDGEQVAW